jgi:diguanylate cyclase (GGDEF)-like protein
MGRVLALSLRSIRLIGELRERQTLLERLTLLQRSIASRADIEDVLDAIVTGASELLGDELVDLSLIDPEDPTILEVVASVGYAPELLAQIRRTPVEIGIAGHAVTERRPIVVEDYGADPRRMPDVVVDGLRAVISAPVYQRGELVGALSLGTRKPGRRYSEIERDAVLAFAEHAGLALNDAKAVEETAHQAFHDPLTGLANRALFVDRLAQARTRAAAAGDTVGVLFADLDGFKTVNDSLGHAAGDQLLIIAGQRLASVVGPTDTVARFGGDEFAVLVEDVRQPIELARLARLALDSLERVVEVEGREVFITASIGIAVGLEEPEDLLRNADLAMYEAKGQGKGRYEICQRHMHEAVAQRLDLELDLKRAADRDEFVLHFQPIVEMEGESVVGVEALIRWMHPTKA